MRKRINISPSIIHFRRWSRKGYAVFCSIGCCVSIRTLNKSVVEASLIKQKQPLAISLQKTTNTVDIQEEKEGPDLPPSPLILLSILIQAQTTDLVCADIFFTLIQPDKNIAGQIYDYICPAFYLYTKKQSMND